MNALITPAEADALLAAATGVLTTELVALPEAAGRVLAEPLCADRPLPPFHRIMMDGIAFSSRGLDQHGGSLSIAGFHPAGAPSPDPLPPGSCWEVGTGAELPPDCDTIVPVEDLQSEGDRVRFDPAVVTPGRFIHRAGSDFAAGEELVPSGSVIGPREAAVAASVGAAQVTVRKRPRVHIFTTGDEVIPFTDAPLPYQIRQSNGPALVTALASLGIVDPVHVHLPDNEKQLETYFTQAFEKADLILCCGGISKGKHDFVGSVLKSLRGDPAFHGIAQRPGKPLAFWSGTPPIFALPGNPMSVLICFHRYVVPLLHALRGTAPPPLQIPLTEAVTFKPDLTWFLPVSLTPDLQATPRPLANSGDFASAIDSTGFLELQADQDHFPAGYPARYIPWL